MKHSFEYCSLRYLDMWLQHDKHYHESINNGTHAEKLISIKKAATYYKIARNLPTKYDKDRGRYEPIVTIIDGVISSDFSCNTIESICKIQKKISKEYGDRNVLSFTTKLLWLKIRNPIIIYDSQVRKVLDTPEGDLPSFYKAWQAKFAEHSNAIAMACSKLSNVTMYACDQTITEADVRDISAQRWFQERVLDTYLWHEGQ